MKRLLALSLMLSVAVPAWAEPPADIGESVEVLRKKVGAAGVSIAIVEDGTPADLISGNGRFATLHAAWQDSLV